MPRQLTAALAACLVLAVSGCGAASGGAPTQLIVSTDFGADTAETARVDWSGGLTAMRQLQRTQSVETQYGGKYISKIGDLAEGGENSWLFYVNGVEADTGATSERLEAGDVVQWDLHNWQTVRTGGATVGAFPRPLDARGASIVCRDPAKQNCSRARQLLSDAGVKVSETAGAEVVVGPWSEIADVDGVRDLTSDAAGNGGYAQFADDGSTVTPARSDGSSGEEHGAGAGLLAAFADGNRLTWVVTGTDSKGVGQAVELMVRENATIANRFAVLVSGGSTEGLPQAAE